MGSEALCHVRFGDQASEGKALLETAELIFRGDFRLRIPFREISSLESEDGELRIGFSRGLAIFDLGRDAEPWAAKIRNPRGLLDKLGVKAGQRVIVLGVEDADFLTQLNDRGVEVCRTLEPDADFVFYEADRPEELLRLQELAASIKQKGGVWVVSPKGKGAQIKDVNVMAAAREAGLVDTKVVSFSDSHTALKLVIPVAKRISAKV
jgi:hypothetical protein